MRSKITTDTSICQAENGFLGDELVKKYVDALENKAFVGILKMNLQLTDEHLMHRTESSTIRAVGNAVRMVI